MRRSKQDERKLRWGRCARVATFAVTLFLGSRVQAFQFYLNQFNGEYGTIGTKLDRCSTCHAGETNFNLNSYGDDFASNGASFLAIEPLDSDGDSFSNLDEILALTFPGDANDTPPPPAVPDIAVNPLSLDLGSVAVGSTASSPLTLANNGTADLNVTGLNITGSGDFSVPTAGLPHLIAPGDSIVLDVSFSPAAPGTSNGTLTVVSNDPDSAEIAVGLTGIGIACDLDLSPLALDFGTIPMNSTSDLSATIRSIGDLDCEVTEIFVDASPEFVVNAPGTPFPLTPGSSAMLQVSYTPVDAGADLGSVLLSTTDPDQPVLVLQLSGAAEAPVGLCDIDVSPLALEFGPVAVGASSTLAVDIGNTGTATCSVNSLSLDPAGDFRLIAPLPALPLILEPGVTVSLSVEYSPSAAGAGAASLFVASDDPDEARVEVTLSGTGSVCEIAASPMSVDFGDVLIGSSARRTVTVSNPGLIECSIATVAVIGDPSEFSIEPIDLPRGILPGASLDLGIGYSPVDAGPDRVSLEIGLSDASLPKIMVSLSGNGVLPVDECDIAVSADAIRFGGVNVGAEKTMAIVVTNNGSAECAVDAVVEGAGFLLPAEAMSRHVLASGASAEVSVVFAPLLEGEHTGALRLRSGDPDAPEILVPLHGLGTMCHLEVDTTALDFGATPVGQTSTRFVLVSNSGSAACRVTQLTLEGAGFALPASSPTAPFEVLPGASIEIAVDFSPVELVPYTGMLTITNGDAEASGAQVALSGTGVEVSEIVDLDIEGFLVTRFWTDRMLRRRPDGIEIRLFIENEGDSGAPRPATVVGTQNGLEIYRETMDVRADLGVDFAVFDFPSYIPTARGDIHWTATIDDDDPDLDEATATTRIRGPRGRRDNEEEDDEGEDDEEEDDEEEDDEEEDDA